MSVSSGFVYQYTGKQDGFFASSGYTLKCCISKSSEGFAHWAPTRTCWGLPFTQLKNSLGAARRAQKVSKLICGLQNLFRQSNKPGHFFQVSPVQKSVHPEEFLLYYLKNFGIPPGVLQRGVKSDRPVSDRTEDLRWKFTPGKHEQRRYESCHVGHFKNGRIQSAHNHLLSQLYKMPSPLMVKDKDKRIKMWYIQWIPAIKKVE